MANATEKKITKRDMFVALMAIPENAEWKDMLQHEVDLIDGRAERANAKKAEKKAAGDELLAKVKAVLTTDLQSAEEIVEAIGEEDVTKAKVVNRLGKLVAAGEVTKEQHRINKKSVMQYALA